MVPAGGSNPRGVPRGFCERQGRGSREWAGPEAVMRARSRVAPSVRGIAVQTWCAGTSGSRRATSSLPLWVSPSRASNSRVRLVPLRVPELIVGAEDRDRGRVHRASFLNALCLVGLCRGRPRVAGLLLRHVHTSQRASRAQGARSHAGFVAADADGTRGTSQLPSSASWFLSLLSRNPSSRSEGW